MAAIKIKLAVDRTQNRVLFADAGSDFIDVLLTFLTLPLSALQFCAGGTSLLGCLSNLRDSVDRLRGSNLLQVDACHGMLLTPSHAHEFWRCHLTHSPHGEADLCETPDSSDDFPLFDDCNCGLVMARLLHVYEKLERKIPFFVTRVMEDTFVGGKQRFVVSDDMTIKPASTSSMQSLPQAFGSDGIAHRFQEVEQLIEWEQVLSMLKSSLSSVTVLTDAFLSKETNNHKAAGAKVKPSINHNTLPFDQDFAPTSPEIKIKIFFDTREKKVTYAECDQEFVDLLLGFTTYPVSCVIKMTGAGTCHLGRCFRNLYRSVIDLDEAGILKDDITTKLLDSGMMSFYFVSNMASCEPLNCPFPKRDLKDCCWHPKLVVGGKYVVEDDLRIHQASAMSLMKHWCGRDKANVLESGDGYYSQETRGCCAVAGFAYFQDSTDRCVHQQAGEALPCLTFRCRTDDTVN